MENVENIIIEHLRAIRADIGLIKDDLREVKTRVSNIESGIGGLKRDNAHLYDEAAASHSRYDRLAERLERIEKRLELTN
jgi:septal ring factor EnvC (AmiA/AmiB activator)